ncbi:MAG: FRG domain-containing protein [Pseudomonadota bacterium]
MPKYLFRGEPAVFPSTVSSWGRMQEGKIFTANESHVMTLLTELATVAINVYVTDPLRAIGWPQHYGFPTYFIDVTSDPCVAMHFAAAGASPNPRVVYRIDLEAIERKVYGKAGKETPLMAAALDGLGHARAARQRAWVIGRRSESAYYDLQACPHVSRHTVRYEVGDADAADYVQPDLLEADDDRHATWPLAILRAIKFCYAGPLPARVVEWICPRVPLFDPTPAKVTYDDQGRGQGVLFLSPRDAEKRGGGPYAVSVDDAIAELTSNEVRVPNGLVVGIPTGGPAGESRWIEPGDEFEAAWLNQLHDWTRRPLPGRVALR